MVGNVTVWSKILPHFGLFDSLEYRTECAARQGAWYEVFIGDTAGKRGATAPVRDTVDRHLTDIHLRLEALSAGGLSGFHAAEQRFC